MRIGQIIALSDHFEVNQIATPIPTNHPPGLKHAKPVLSELPQDGWHPNDSKKKKKKARRDLKKIMDKTIRQTGRTVMVQHAKVPVYDTYGRGF